MTRLEMVEMPAAEGRALWGALTKLERLLEASDSFITGAAETVVPGSPIDQARKAGVRDPYDIAYALIFSAEDHLRTSVIVLRHGPLPGFALYTLLRAAAEALARAAYLLELPLTLPVRLGRTLNERLDNLDEQRKFMAVADDEHYLQSVDTLKSKALSNGVEPLYSKARQGAPKLIGFGAPRRSVTELLDQFIRGGEQVHRYLSGYAHSKMWAQFPRSRAQASPNTPGVALAATDLDVMDFIGLLTAVTDLYDEDLGNYLSLAGYPRDVWRLAKQRRPQTGKSTPPA
jgi:hypothetical protein